MYYAAVILIEKIKFNYNMTKIQIIILFSSLIVFSYADLNAILERIRSNLCFLILLDEELCTCKTRDECVPFCYCDQVCDPVFFNCIVEPCC